METGQANTFRRQMMALSRRLRQEHTGDVPLNEVLVIGAIDRLGPGATPSTVADDLHMARPNLAPLLRKLDERGLISRTPDPDDGRRTVVALTRAGEQLLARDRRERELWLVSTIGSALTDDEVRTLIKAGALMQRIADYQGEAR